MSYKALSLMTSPTGPGELSCASLCSVLCSDVLRNRGAEPTKLRCFHYFRSGEKITVTPSSKELLFYPPSLEATVSGGRCRLREPMAPFAVIPSSAFKHLFCVVVAVKPSL